MPRELILSRRIFRAEIVSLVFCCLILAGASTTLEMHRLLLLPAVPAALLVVVVLIRFPELNVGLLQGGLGIPFYAFTMLDIAVPQGLPIVLFSGLALAGGFWWALKTNRLEVLLTPLSALILIQAGLIILGVSYSWNDLAAIKAAQFIALNLVSFAVGAFLTSERRGRLYGIFIVVALALSLGALVHFAVGGEGWRAGRYSALGIQTIWLGRLVGLGLITALLSPALRRFPVLLRVAIFTVLASGFMLANSRGPMVSLLLALVFVSLFRLQGKSRGVIRMLCYLVAAVVLMVSFSTLLNVGGRWNPFRIAEETNLEDANVLVRIKHVQRAIDDLQGRPLFGFGTAGYSGSDADRNPEGENWPHNMSLEILAEQGLVGFVVYVLILVLVVFRIIVLLDLTRGAEVFREEVLLVSSLLIYAFLNAHSSGTIPDNRLIWLLLGLLLGLGLDFGRMRFFLRQPDSHGSQLRPVGPE